MQNKKHKTIVFLVKRVEVYSEGNKEKIQKRHNKGTQALSNLQA